MAPTAQSVDASSPSFTMGSVSQTPESTQSSLLFKKPTMRPPLKAPLRVSNERFSKSLVGEDLSSEEARRREVLRLKKRFLKSRESTSAYFAKTETRRKIMREVCMCVPYNVVLLIFCVE